MQSTAEDRRCGVCTRDFFGPLHLGVEVCRACIAFFRRSIANDKKYICRRGQGQCPLNCSRKVLCQKCRMDKCVEIGVNGDSVRRQREQSHTDDDELPDTISPRRSPKIEVVSLPRVPTPQWSLTGILDLYKRSQIEREFIERNYPGQQQRIIKMGEKSMNVPSYTRMCGIYAAQHQSLMDFVEGAFPELREFPEEHKTLVTGHFETFAWLLESIFMTYQLIPKQKTQERLLLTAYSYIDDAGIPYTLDHASDPNDKDKLIHVSGAMFRQVREGPLRAFYRIKPDEKEIVAILGLLLWSPKVHRLLNDEVASKCRAKVFEALYHHHKYTLNLKNPMMRMGEVMKLFSDMQLAQRQISCDVLFMNLFNMNEAESYIFDIYKAANTAVV